MSMFKFASTSSYDKPSPSAVTQRVEIVVKHEVAEQRLLKKVKTRVDPDPRKFRVLRSEHVRENLVLEVEYEGCIYYEGRKILLYKDCSFKLLKKQIQAVGLDPHFSDTIVWRSPFARFAPTAAGWSSAVFLAREI